MGMVEKALPQILIRNMRREDIPAGLRLCRLSGWNQLEDDWAIFLRSNPAGSRIAEKHGQAVGTVATLRYQDRFSWLSMVLVDPIARREGIGTRLLNEGLSLLENEACIRLDATAAGRRLYGQHGFVDEYPLTRFTAPADVARSVSAVTQLRLMREQDLPAVLNRDCAIFGADRGPLLRSLFARSPEYAWVAGLPEIRGYCFGRPGFLYQQLGPIVAENETIACDLLSQCLAQKTSQRLGIDAPQHSSSWLDCLKSNGFVEERSFMRMRRGANTYPGRPECVFAIVGPEFG